MGVEKLIVKGGRWLASSGTKAEKALETGSKAALNLSKAAVVGSFGYGLFSGKGFLPLAQEAVLGKDASERVNREGALTGLVDWGFGEGTTEKMSRNVDHAIDGIKTAASGVKSAVSEAMSPTPGQQPAVAADPYGQYGQQYGQPVYQQGAATGPFSSVNHFVENMTGGKMGAMDAAGLLTAAYMMFGSRFGWMGKVASMLIGGYTVKDMQQRQQAMQMQQLAVPYGYQPGVAYPQQAQPQYAPGYNPAPVVEQEERPVVSRMRM